MNVAYLTYQYDNNPQGIPAGWPSQVLELGDDSTSPGDNWVVCTLDEYNSYIASVQSSYDTWLATNPGPGIPVTAENYEVNTYSSRGMIVSSTWYANKIAIGSYTSKARDIIYSYDSTGVNLLSSVESTYDSNGNVLTSVTKNYLSSTSQVVLETVTA